MKKFAYPVCVAATLAMTLSTVHAQDNFPARPVRIVSVSGAGTGVDDYSRVMAHYLSQKLKQSFVVENKPGGNYVIATSYVANAAPDGYTLLFTGSGGMTANTALYKQLAYDPIKDFVPIARLSMAPIAVVVPGTSQYHTVAQLVAAAQKNPGALNYGTSSSAYQVIVVAFNDAARIKATNVSYKSTTNLLQDLIGNTIDYGIAEVSAVIPLVKAGKLRALAVTSPDRLPQLNDVPTMAEAGLDGAAFVSWTGLFAPAGTPPAVVEKISNAAQEFVNSSEAKQHHATRGTLPYAGSSEVLRETLISDQRRWKRFVKLSGIEPQ